MTQPTLLRPGTAEPLTSAQLLRYRACRRGAELRWLPRANHVPMSDAPGVVAEHMLEFLDRVAVASPVAA